MAGERRVLRVSSSRNSLTVYEFAETLHLALTCPGVMATLDLGKEAFHDLYPTLHPKHI